MAWNLVCVRGTVGGFCKIPVDLLTCTSVVLVRSQDASAR
jgi:hypothetical protein